MEVTVMFAFYLHLKKLTEPANLVLFSIVHEELCYFGVY